MELLLLDQSRFALLYNCTFYTVDQIPLEGRQSILGGILLITLFLIFEILYIPCTVALSRLLDQSCYKIMFAIGVADLLALPLAGLTPGLFALGGFVFCSAPQLMFTVGMMVNWVWCLETSLAALLAANRCAELLVPSLGNLLFRNRRCWLWILAILMYSLFYGFFGTSPAIWSSHEFTWVYNPHKDYVDGMDEMYVNKLDVMHSIAITTSIPGFYALFLLVLLVKRKKIKHHDEENNSNNYTFQQQKRMTRIIFLQVLLLCATNAGVSFCYALMGFVPVPSIVVVICGTWLWLFLHGHPPFIYLLLNSTIRAQIHKMVPIPLPFIGSGKNSGVKNAVAPTKTQQVATQQKFVSQHNFRLGMTAVEAPQGPKCTVSSHENGAK